MAMYLIQLLYREDREPLLSEVQNVLDKGHTLKALCIDGCASQLLIIGSVWSYQEGFTSSPLYRELQNACGTVSWPILTCSYIEVKGKVPIKFLTLSNIDVRFKYLYRDIEDSCSGMPAEYSVCAHAERVTLYWYLCLSAS